MAQVIRAAIATQAAAAQSTSRPASPVRGLSSSDGAPIDGLNGGVNVTNSESGFLFDDFRDDGEEQREPEHRQPIHLARVDINSETFATVLKADMTQSEADGRASARGASGFAGLLKKAISTYETNARVIAGEEKFRGTRLSFVL